jgi:putative ABC transport system substrate-binding protein
MERSPLSGYLEPIRCPFRASEAAVSNSLGMTVTPAGLRSAAEIEPALRAFAKEPNGDPHRCTKPIQYNQPGADHCPGFRIASTGDLSVPLLHREWRPCFLCFDTADRGAASYVDRIPRGEKPDNLPVQAPTKYDLVINLKTGKALGLNISLQLQQRADGVTE